ncbi:Kelch-like protein 10 like protein [Argiope bruennichi]|uniref:Kelch-like protein 10 like protein n=1 Tax=Argiope bruennichi TaxID=94029 RepID=A0A8T0ES20_ARGBR|nr:Kelch-like protein 10 like protein [Argiope bruennichi]
MQCQQLKFVDVFNSDPYKELDSFSDGVLRTEDGREFKIHRILLAQRCLFFKVLFCGDFTDGADVLLKGIDAETLDHILVYLYTGTIRLNEENATDILVASDYLLIDPLLQECRSFVLREMTPTNCISLFLIAWQIERLGILDQCHRFIVIHFEEVVSNSEEISSLPLEALKRILREKCLNVTEERTVWNVIVRWIKFDFPYRLQFVPELLKYVSLEDADEPLANDIMLHNIVKENNTCRELTFNKLQHTPCLQNFQQILKSQSVMSGPRIPSSLHLIAHYCVAHTGCSINIYLTCDDEIDYWRKIDSVHFFPDCLIQLGNYVYMFDTWINKSLAFDMLEEKCLPMTPISKTRCRYSVVSVNGFIYVMGGAVEAFDDIEDIERFDPSTGRWELVSHMIPMSLSEAVALNGYIYAIGDVGGEPNPIMMVQVYDPASDRWSSVSAPRLFRHEFTAIAFRGHLYLIGGETFDCVLRSTEEYDPVNDVWIPMPDLPVAYLIPRAVVLKDVLIVYEENLEHRSCGGNTPPVYWDSENRTWHIIQESSPLRMIHMYKFCTITEPHIIKEIVKRNRHQSNRWSQSSASNESIASLQNETPEKTPAVPSLQDRLHEELKRRVSLTNSKKAQPVAFITPLSSAEDVQFWLSAKGFAARTQQKFQNMRGDELFAMGKLQMEKELGLEEGFRLFNQITIQKNICGFKTLSSKELSSVLEARRKKIDPDDEFSDRRDSNDSVASSLE